jgi:hypothetical protein
MTENEPKNNQNLDNTQDGKKPNEKFGLMFSSHFKIYDPNTKEVLVQKRGDN